MSRFKKLKAINEHKAGQNVIMAGACGGTERRTLWPGARLWLDLSVSRRWTVLPLLWSSRSYSGGCWVLIGKLVRGFFCLNNLQQRVLQANYMFRFKSFNFFVVQIDNYVFLPLLWFRQMTCFINWYVEEGGLEMSYICASKIIFSQLCFFLLWILIFISKLSWSERHQPLSRSLLLD